MKICLDSWCAWKEFKPKAFRGWQTPQNDLHGLQAWDNYTEEKKINIFLKIGMGLS